MEALDYSKQNLLIQTVELNGGAPRITIAESNTEPMALQPPSSFQRKHKLLNRILNLTIGVGVVSLLGYIAHSQDSNIDNLSAPDESNQPKSAIVFKSPKPEATPTLHPCSLEYIPNSENSHDCSDNSTPTPITTLSPCTLHVVDSNNPNTCADNPR